jgi:hypothetical protein
LWSDHPDHALKGGDPFPHGIDQFRAVGAENLSGKVFPSLLGSLELPLVIVGEVVVRANEQWDVEFLRK